MEATDEPGLRVSGSIGHAVAIGVVLVTAAAFPVGAAFAKSVSGISRIEAPVFMSMVAVLLLTGGLATLIPAARAAGIDPLSALRQA